MVIEVSSGCMNRYTIVPSPGGIMGMDESHCFRHVGFVGRKSRSLGALVAYAASGKRVALSHPSLSHSNASSTPELSDAKYVTLSCHQMLHNRLTVRL